MTEKEFKTLIKQKRIEKHIMLKDMANRLNISSSYYSKIENDKIKINYELIKRISEILEIDLNIIKDSIIIKKVIFYD